ncbi:MULTISPECIES: Mu transposase C-terminal domain-containing protein [Mycobacterium]|uniref:Integrase n=1 Tax=Mycobacterium haemophilum TaxID=29311 RepID=A0A0I9YBP3_9MYCO|nr:MULTISPECIES: Mu transposase C-terminal domain-containing protein [Mycobacterium]PJE03283.1 MAG: integrase [Mycobacterium sp.]KLO27167.1 integrase [Mycobacterium haemophilum]KLO37302.1 integrase [Mycobacterium haemophilum]KLO38356.1 integrase [Mycobacterium haemophilum]KLO45236.1 integrase [Mycobacterium haemophilum]
MTAARPAVLRPGDRVEFDGGEHQVLGLVGTAVRLRSGEGVEQVVLVSHLLSSAAFALLGHDDPVGLEPFGLLDGLPTEIVDAAREWERHVVEVETGLPPGAEPGAVFRGGYDPALTTVSQRAEKKAAELGVSVRTVHSRRARYARQGLWGLVDQRGARQVAVTGRADARLVAAVREALDAETHTSTGTRTRLMRRVVAQLESEHGPGVVPLPGRSAFYRLIEALATGRHSFGSAVTRRQTANRPSGMFTPSFAARPGEQVQIDSTPIDVLVLLDDGTPARADLTIVVDVATRTICAAVLRPVGTKAVDAALLLARMLVPEPMRPGWSQALRMSASVMPHARLLDIDMRMELAAARPVIVPDTITIDGGKVFVSDTFTRACERLGISVQQARPHTPTDKAIVEATFGSINTLFCQHVASYTGANATRRGADVAGTWTLVELQDLLDEWLLAGWQTRPHDALRDPLAPRRMLSPNEKYTALVAAAGYLPLTLTGEDYLELLPVTWRQINAYGIKIDYRTYDCPELGPLRLQHSGVTARRGLWEVHYDPYDATRVFVRTREGWLTVPWTHLPMVTAPFAEFTWRHARTLTAQRGGDASNETQVARVLDDLLTRAAAGPVDKRTDRVAARTRLTGVASSLIPLPDRPEPEPESTAEPLAALIPFGVFDADAEADKW